MNPLLNVLAECRHIQDTPKRALLKVMMVLLNSTGPDCIRLAALWHERFGAPDYDKLDAYAKDFAADPANAVIMEGLCQRHHETMASFSEEGRAEVTAYLKE